MIKDIKRDSLTELSNLESLFNNLKESLIDPLARDIANEVNWVYLKNISKDKYEKYPIAITGEGSPVLLLHGFDSSFLEFRRLVPLLKKNHKLIIPDMFGFGFCPRPIDGEYGKEGLIRHLIEVLNQLTNKNQIGLIGASMGGGVAMELAKRCPNKFNRLLLLAPAGLTGKPTPLPPLIDKLGVWFLSQPIVRKGLCRQAFAFPDKNVGKAEEQIASLHLSVPGWGNSLAAFARKGDVANCGNPIPPQKIKILLGRRDWILNNSVKKEILDLLGQRAKEIKDCGHLPHIDCPQEVANEWLEIHNFK